LLIVATLVVNEVHLAVLVRFCVLPSLYVPVAANCCVPPNEIDGYAGVTAIDISTGGLIVRLVDPIIAPSVAVTLVVPRPALVASPWVPAVLLIVATPERVDPQVTEVVKFAEWPSVNVPVAVNC
jgi:hypothetical protein